MYPETADIETSSDGYARRFSGSVGAWMLEIQEEIVAGWLAGRPAATVLDVGGGHAQLAGPLARRGHPVTVLGSDSTCAHRLRDEIAAGRVAFTTGNVIELPFADKSFDVAVSIRLVPHCERWQVLIEELCRVARLAVIIDYPARRSVNALSGAMFGLKKSIEGNTRPVRLVHARRDPGRVRPASLRARAGPATVLRADGVPPHPQVARRVLRARAPLLEDGIDPATRFPGPHRDGPGHRRPRPVRRQTHT